MKRFTVFLASFLSILSVGYAYICLRLATTSIGWAVIAIPFVYVAVASIPLRQRLANSRRPAARIALGLNGAAMAWTSFALSCALLRDLLLGPPVLLGWLDARGAFGPASNAVTIAASFAALAWGYFGGLRGPRLREVEIKVAGLPPELDGFAMAQITDLHIGPSIRRPYVQAVVDLVNRSAVDLVALTGDIVDGPSASLRSHAEPLAGLLPRGRVYYVPGNHEYYWDAQAWFAIFRQFGFRLLLNEGEAIGKGSASVWLGGVVDPAASTRLFDSSAVLIAPDVGASITAHGRGLDFKILLAHQPNVGGRHADAAGYDVQVSGHTHGGQFFPWTIVVRWVQRYYLGLFREGGLQMYVSSGAGSWGPPVRFGTRTEVARIVFRPT